MQIGVMNKVKLMQVIKNPIAVYDTAKPIKLVVVAIDTV